MSWRSPRRRAARSPGRPDRSPGQPNMCNGERGPDAPPSEMLPSFRQDQHSSAPDELILDMLLDGVPPPPEPPPQVAALLPMLADLSGPAEPGELAAETAVLSRFRNRVRLAGISGTTHRPSRRTSPWRRLVPHSPRVSAALAAAAITLGGTAAAYAGALPQPLQDFAHSTIDAPAARHAPQQPGHGPRHQPGITQPGSGSHRHTPQSATPGAASNHTQPGHNGDTAKATHPAQPRPSAEPSPQPGQAGHPGQPLLTGRPPQVSRPPRQSHPPQPNQQARTGQPSRQGRLAPTRSTAQAGQARQPETTCSSPGSHPHEDTWSAPGRNLSPAQPNTANLRQRASQARGGPLLTGRSVGCTPAPGSRLPPASGRV
jgi:hypothetical protein